MTAVPWHGEPYIRAAVLHGFGDIVKPRGGNALELLNQAGIDPAALADPDMLISWPRLGILMESTAAILDAPYLGLEWALSIPPHFPNVGPIIFLAQLAGNLGGWIEQSMRYWRYYTNAYSLHLFDDKDSETVTLRFSQNLTTSSQRQQMEFLFGTCCHMARVVTGKPEMSTVLVRFRHREPGDLGLHKQIFGPIVEFDAPENEITFFRTHLSSPTDGRLDSLRSVANSFIRDRIRHMPLYSQSVRTTTEITIQTVLGTGMCTKEFIAASMGTNPRKLHRLLANQGTSFADLLDETRKTMAYRMLSQTDVPVSAIAGLLEYSSTTALTLAMKRWTGMTPSAYRARPGIDEQAIAAAS